MHHIQSPVGLPLLNDAADVDLAGALTDHLDIDTVLAQCAEESSGNADHAPQLAADEGDDGHAGDKVDVAAKTRLGEIVDGVLEGLGFDGELVWAGTREQRVFAVKCHGDMHFGRRDQVHGKAVTVQGGEDGHQEAVSACALLAVHVKHSDVRFDGDSGRSACKKLG